LGFGTQHHTDSSKLFGMRNLVGNLILLDFLIKPNHLVGSKK
jgi:hypothetical protein